MLTRTGRRIFVFVLPVLAVIAYRRLPAGAALSVLGCNSLTYFVTFRHKIIYIDDIPIRFLSKFVKIKSFPDMAQKLRVLTPQTTDGKTLAYDEKNHPVYNESIVEVAAKADFDNLNAKLPKHLQHKLEIFDDGPKKEKKADDKKADDKKEK